MKCIRCGHDAKYKERPNRQCPSCKGSFAFEPKQGDLFTDRGFLNAIEAVSGGGTVRFLPRHVYYQLNRLQPWSPALPIAVGVLSIALGFGFVLVSVGAGGLLCGLLSLPLVFWGLGVPIGLALAATTAQATVGLPATAFDAAWQRWLAVHGQPAGVLEPRRLLAAPEPIRSADLESEIRSYSFDRAVICDRPELVDLLIANRFHFENNCAILSVDGYPEAAFDTVRAMLANNPSLLVLVLHDATPDGCRLARRLATDPAWFGGTARVVDVGLRPGHARFFPGKVLRRRPVVPVPPDDAITPSEADWLAKYALETAVIWPEQLVKRLYRAMTTAESGALAVMDGGSSTVYFLGHSTGTVDGGADSFG